MPLQVVRQLESGTLPQEQRSTFAQLIEEYESLFGPASSRRPARRRIYGQVFPTEEAAQSFAEEVMLIPPAYYDVVPALGGFQVARMR